MDTKQPEGFEAWAVVELMGHRRLAGFVTEQEVFGAGLLRIDVPGEGDAMTTQFYSPAALYCLTPVSETVARAYAAKNYMRPISAFDLALPAPAIKRAYPDDDDGEFEDDSRVEDDEDDTPF